MLGVGGQTVIAMNNGLDINLLPGKNAFVSAERVVMRKLAISFFLISGVIALVLALAFFGGLFVSKRNADLQKQYQKTLTDFESVRAKAEQIDLIADKAVGIAEIRQTRTNFVAMANAVTTLLGRDINLVSAELGTNGTMNLDLKAGSVGSFDSLLDKLVASGSAGERFTKVVLSGLTIGSDQSVALTVKALYVP